MLCHSFAHLLCIPKETKENSCYLLTAFKGSNYSKGDPFSLIGACSYMVYHEEEEECLIKVANLDLKATLLRCRQRDER